MNVAHLYSNIVNSKHVLIILILAHFFAIFSQRVKPGYGHLTYATFGDMYVEVFSLEICTYLHKEIHGNQPEN